MKKALTIGLAGAAVAAALSFVATGLKSESPVVSEAKATEAEPATIVLAQNTASVLNYERGPRIIVVPQAGDRTDYGNTDRGNSRVSVNRDAYEDDDVAPPVRATPRWTPRTETPRRVETPVKPRSELRQEKRVVRHIDMSKPKAKTEIPEAPIPQPPSPRRAVLSAPPPSAEGPSPTKPTPRFDSNLDSKPDVRAESAIPPDAPSGTAVGETPPPAEITADSPPPGYTPPAAPMRDDGYGNKY